MSRCIEECLKDNRGADTEDVKPYPIEDVIAESKQTEIDIREGRLQGFDSAEEMLKALGI